MGFISTTFLCHGQQVPIPQCPQFAGTPQVSASCITSVTDIAFDSMGTGWIADNTYRAPGRVLRFPGIKVGQIPSSSQTADLVLGKPNLSTLANSSCQACSLNVPTKLAFDKNGALWVADQNSFGFSSPMLYRFSPPFTSGQAADLVVPAYSASGGMIFDAAGNLWIANPYSCGSVLEYSPPFSATMQPSVLLGQPSPTSCVAIPGPSVLSGAQGLAFGPDGSLFVGDTASNRIAVFKPPFRTFMNAALAIGQANLTNYQALPFAQGGLGGIFDLAIDGTGKLWVLTNNQDVSIYSPPFSTGAPIVPWFDFITGQTSNGTSFPFTFNGYSSLRFTSDSSMWLASSGTSGGLGTFAVLMPSVLQLVELSPTISFLGSSATGSSPFAAGQLISIYGTQLGPTPGSSGQEGPGGVVTNSNGGTQILFDGIAAPELYTGATQINTAIPCSVAGKASTQMVVQYLGASSSPYTVPLSIAAPGIFTANGTGSGQAVVLNQDYSLNGPANPAARGSAVSFYATGIGPTSPCVDGQTYQSNFPLATLPVVAGVGNLGAQVLYAGQAPYFMTGVDQINIVIPSGSPTGSVALSLLVNGVFSPPGVTIAVK